MNKVLLYLLPLARMFLFVSGFIKRGFRLILHAKVDSKYRSLQIMGWGRGRGKSAGTCIAGTLCQLKSARVSALDHAGGC